MIRKLLREFYLLPLGEQRALLLLSLLVMLSLGARIGFRMLPAREPPGMDQFREEAMAFLAALEEADSLEQIASSQKKYDSYLAVPQADSGTQKKRVPDKIPAVDLNAADSLTLLPLPGIGPVFASRIVKYRNLLGGFVHKEQLLEVYGMDSSRYLPLIPLINVYPDQVLKLKLNHVSFRDLLRHPYLEYDDVKALLNYRNQQGHISSVSEIWEHGLLGDSTLERIAPYLLFSF